MKKTFEQDKNAEELGIDTTRRFVVVKGDEDFDKGDILELPNDDETTYPYFKRISDGERHFMYWSSLAYADKTLRDMEVGDIVIDEDGDEREVLAVCGKLFAYSFDKGSKFFNELADWIEFYRAEDLGWKLKDQAEEETVSILGKTYDKQAVEERLKELKEIR